MAVFDKAFALEITELIAEVGQPISVKRLGASVTSGKGVFVASKAKDIEASSLPGVAGTASTTKTLLLQPTVTKPPLVGDVVVCSQGTYTISAVSVTSPSGVVRNVSMTLLHPAS